MSITIRFFASMKEAMQTSQLQYELPSSVSDVSQLKQLLLDNEPKFALACEQVGRVRVAVNQEMADDSTPLKPGAEVAFFPPVTGG